MLSLAQGVTPLPSSGEMWNDIKAKRDAMSQRYVSSPRHTIQVDYIPFMDDVAKEFGCRPDIGWFDTVTSIPEVFYAKCFRFWYDQFMLEILLSHYARNNVLM